METWPQGEERRRCDPCDGAGSPPPPGCSPAQVCRIPQGGGHVLRAYRRHKGPSFTQTTKTYFFGCVCAPPPPHPLPPRVPPSPRTHTDTHGHSRREVSGFGGRVSEGTFNPPANSFPSEDKKIKGRPETLLVHRSERECFHFLLLCFLPLTKMKQWSDD